MRSTSSRIKEHLLKLDERGINQLTFTGEDLFRDMPDCTRGGISGFLSKAADAGALTIIGKKGRYFQYTLTDLGALRALRVRKTASNGSTLGREDGPHRSRKVVTREAITQRLLELAAELEQMRTPLEQFSTDELLQELLRRQRA